ncbi:MAG: hypothetical protein JWN04_5397, partial [Myxococcaceae bacterium]|nr:hypothetical protein [Myxococcaceae bacterium]
MSAQTVKGSHVFQVKSWVDKRLGPGEFTRMTRHAGDNWTVVLPVAWYDVEVVNDVMKQASLRTGISVEEISTEVCRLNAERDLTTLYRFFLRVAQPQRVLEHTPKLWR